MVAMFSGRGRRLDERDEPAEPGYAGPPVPPLAPADEPPAVAEFPIRPVLPRPGAASGEDDADQAHSEHVVDGTSLELAKALSLTAQSWYVKLTGHEYAFPTKRKLADFISDIDTFVAIHESIQDQLTKAISEGGATESELDELDKTLGLQYIETWQPRWLELKLETEIFMERADEAPEPDEFDEKKLFGAKKSAVASAGGKGAAASSSDKGGKAKKVSAGAKGTKKRPSGSKRSMKGAGKTKTGDDAEAEGPAPRKRQKKVLKRPCAAPPVDVEAYSSSGDSDDWPPASSPPSDSDLSS